MTGEVTAWVLDLMRGHGGLAVFLGVIIDSFILPFPSQLVLIAAGAVLVEPGNGPAGAFLPILLRIVLPGSLGLTLGAYFPYGAAYWGGKPVVERCRAFLGFGWEDMAAMGRRLEGRAGATIFLLRAALVVPLTLISAAAGVLRMPFWPFSLWTYLGSVPRCLALGYLGFFTRDAYEGLAERLGAAQAWGALAGAAVILAGVFWLRRRAAGRRHAPEAVGTTGQAAGEARR